LPLSRCRRIVSAMTTLPRTLARAALLAALVPTAAWPQALTSITSVYVGYASRRATANPTGELKERLDSVDRDLREANRLGRIGEMRRLFAKGNALLSGRAWTDSADFTNSLLLRTDRVVVESQQPYVVRLEQLYTPSIQLTRALSARARLVSRRADASGASSFTVVKEFEAVQGVSRDLRESPQEFELDLRGVPDGRYFVVVEVADSTRALGNAALGVALYKGIDERASRLENEARNAPEAWRAEILYPVDRMRNVNRGRVELRTLDVDKDFASAEAVLAAVKAHRDPFAGRTGDFERHYTLDDAKEVIPFRMYVPTAYTSSRAFPLIIALHGLGGTEDSFFEAYGRKLPELAEQSGYIVAAPLGYRVDGQYGWGVGNPPADPKVQTLQRLSEADVMQVLAQAKRLYNVDPNRIYLMGHSMGAIGTWKLAAKYPDIWAALGPFSGRGEPATVERMRSIPQFVVHGDADPTVNVAGSRTMVAAMKSLNVDVTYIEVPGGNHGDVVEPNFSGMFQFFDAHRKGARP
jgi:poly(3-hydroxybutyrate) depolymerase